MKNIEVEVDPLNGEAGSTVESEKEKQRQKWRVKKQKQRAALKQHKQALGTEDRSEWFERNRAELKSEELADWKAQDDYVRDLLFSMETVVNVRELGPELIEIVTEFVRENPCPHLGYVMRSHEIPSDWSTGVLRKNAKYWQDAALLELLYAEGPATERYVKYGLLSGIPDWRVARFLTDKAKWPWEKVSALLGYITDDGKTRYV